MAILDPKQQAARLPLDIAHATQVVESGLAIADRVLRGASTDEKVTGFVVALRELHLDVAGAIFDSRLPAKLVRNGETPAAPKESR